MNLGSTLMFVSFYIYCSTFSRGCWSTRTFFLVLWSTRTTKNSYRILPFFFFFFFYCLLSRSISDHYLRSCGNVTCSWPQRKALRLRIEPGTSGTGVNHSTPAPVRSLQLMLFTLVNSYFIIGQVVLLPNRAPFVILRLIRVDNCIQLWSNQ